MQDLLLVGPALQPSDFLDLCRAVKPESVLFHPETTALRIKAINAAAADQLEAQAQGKAVVCGFPQSSLSKMSDSSHLIWTAHSLRTNVLTTWPLLPAADRRWPA